MSQDPFHCLICGKSQTAQFMYQFRLHVCDSCAEGVANLWYEAHSGEFLTWPNPQKSAKSPTRKQLSATTMLAVWRRDGFRCVKCDATEDLTVDHIKARANGGADDMQNLQTLCRTCNCRKGKRLEVAA